MKKILKHLPVLGSLTLSLLLLAGAIFTEHPWWSLTGLMVLALLDFYRPKTKPALYLLGLTALSLGLFALGRPYKEQHLINDVTEVIIDGMGLKAQLTQPIGQNQIPVLVYHKVVETPAPNDPFEYSLERFEKEMTYLKENGYTTLSLADYRAILLEGKSAPDKAILLTFDDITSDFYDNVFPILTQNGQTATLFAVSDWIDQPKYLSCSQLLELEQAGFAIQNHSKSHPRLSQLSKTEQEEELSTGKNTLNQLLDQEQISMATPYGNHNADTLTVAKSLQTDLVFTGLAGIPSSDLSEPYQLPRIGLLQSHDFEEFKQFIN